MGWLVGCLIRFAGELATCGSVVVFVVVFTGAGWSGLTGPDDIKTGTVSSNNNNNNNNNDNNNNDDNNDDDKDDDYKNNTKKSSTQNYTPLKNCEPMAMCIIISNSTLEWISTIYIQTTTLEWISTIYTNNNTQKHS